MEIAHMKNNRKNLHHRFHFLPGLGLGFDDNSRMRFGGIQVSGMATDGGLVIHRATGREWMLSLCMNDALCLAVVVDVAGKTT